MAELQFPDIIGRYQQGLQFGRQMRSENEAKQNQSRLSELAARAYGASSEERPNLIQQAIGINPQAGFSLDDQLGEQDKQKEATMLSTARLLLSAPEELRPSIYRRIYPEVSKHLEGLPPDYTPELGEGIRKGLEAYVSSRGGGQRDTKVVGNALVDSSGNVIYQSPEQARYFLTDQGLVKVGPTGAEEVQLGGGDTMPMPQPDASGMRIDPGLPQNVQDAIRSNPQGINAAIDAAPEGGSIEIPNGQDQYGRPMPQGRRLGPPVNAAQQQQMRLAIEANQRAEEASRRADEAAKRARLGNAPPGYQWNPEGTAVVPIPGAPPPASKAASEDERKAAGWFNQAQNAFNNMEAALAADPSANEPGFIETYSPIEEISNRVRSPTRQNYVQASESFGEAVLRAATGAGVNKDEARQKSRELTPQRGDSPQQRAQKRASLSVYLQSLKQRAGRALPAPSSGPQVGAVEDGYRYKGGDPADQNNWEQVR